MKLFLMLLLTLELFAQVDSTIINNSKSLIRKIESKSTAFINNSNTLNKELKKVPLTNNLYFSNGNKLSGKVEFKMPIFSNKYILLNDSTKFNPREVKAFSNSEGYFARVENSSDFVKRVVEGNIDLYRETKTYSSPGIFNTVNTPGGSFTTYSPGNFSTNSYEYFSKNDGPVMDASYSNLLEAFSDNVESIQLLNEYRTLTYVRWGGTIAGIGIIASSFIGVDEETPPKLGTILLGGLVANLSYWITSSAQDEKLNQAIEVYNGLRK